MKDFIPLVGDRKSRKALDEVFSRDVLGAVVLGTVSGKVVEYTFAMLVITIFGPDAAPMVEAFGFWIFYATAVPIGIWVFAAWHNISDAASEKAEDAKDKATEVKDGKN